MAKKEKTNRGFVLRTNLKYVMGTHPELWPELKRLLDGCERVWSFNDGRIEPAEPAKLIEPVGQEYVCYSDMLTATGPIPVLGEGEEVFGLMPLGRAPRLRPESLARNHNPEKTQERFDRLLIELQGGG